MERETGIEPATSSLGSLRSTPELLPLPKRLPNDHRQPNYGKKDFRRLPIEANSMLYSGLR